MMIVKMDKMSAPPSRELAQRLYDQNVELENRRRKSAQARVPSDPNAWQQMRENYEAIILEDHAFSEQQNIEYTLWQLHYRRIEELRAHFSAALASTGSAASQGGKGLPRPDRITKIRLQFKTFLSETTGFYHDLILKIRSKYGLPLGNFSEDPANQIVSEKDGKKSSDMKKGLISCHRCLIYLGDLARYKGLYGEGDSKTGDYAAASSYYLQAISLWPPSGNPHHQLAILASYSGDELVAVYRYFRSLAVDSPFTTARDNLLVAFEKNRQSYSQLFADPKTSSVEELPSRNNAKGRKKELYLSARDTNTGASLVHEKYKSFCVKFVRLNGILYTRTSLETFAEVLSSVGTSLNELSSGLEDHLNIATDSAGDGLVIVRLVSILIFTVHNVNKYAEGQTYAEILQRRTLLQNAFTLAFELMGHIMQRSTQLQDPSSSKLLPGILVFAEWLACCPDVAAGSDMDEKQETVRSKFWNHFICLLNKLLSNGSVSVDDEQDETCFFNMSRYDEGDSDNRLALWEDFELRGFLPILPAHSILDFSRNHSHGSDGSNKAKIARVRRVIAAGKALGNVVKVDQKAICFDSKAKKFVVGIESQASDNFVLPPDLGMAKTTDTKLEIQTEKSVNMDVVQVQASLYMEAEEEDEVIVFRPTATENRIDSIVPKSTPYGGHDSIQSVSVPMLDIQRQIASDSRSRPAADESDVSRILKPIQSHIIHQNYQPIQSHASNWLVEQQASLANGLKGLSFLENGHMITAPENTAIPYPAPLSLPHTQSVNAIGLSSYQKKPGIPSAVDSMAFSRSNNDNFAPNTLSAFPANSRKNPVSRPVRHMGPPPGFSTIPQKQVNGSFSGSDLKSYNPPMDDYSWLDGHARINGSINLPSHGNPQSISNGNGFTGPPNFPFPGKQTRTIQYQEEKQKGWQDYQLSEQFMKLNNEQNLMQQQQFIERNQHQYQGQYGWTGH